MPLLYTFTDHDGTVKSLDDVDREMCELLNVPYDEKKFCKLWQITIPLLPRYILTRESVDPQGQLTEQTFDQFRETDEAKQMNFSEREWKTLRCLLVERYTFDMVYSRI